MQRILYLFLHNWYWLALISFFFAFSDHITTQSYSSYFFISPFNRPDLHRVVLRCPTCNIYASLIWVVLQLLVFTYVDSPMMGDILHLNTVCRRAGSPPHNLEEYSNFYIQVQSSPVYILKKVLTQIMTYMYIHC